MTVASFQPPRMRSVARQAMIEHLRDLPIGTRLPPLRDLARELGLGRCNLQDAMRDLAVDGLVVSRPRLGTFVARKPAGPHDTDDAHPTRWQQSMTGDAAFAGVLANKRIALYSDDFADPLFTLLINTIAKALRHAGATMVERHTSDCQGPAGESSDPVDMALFVNPPLQYVPYLPETIPTVVVSTSWNDGFLPQMRYDLIGVDQQRGAMLAGELLRQHGFAEACFLGVRSKEKPDTWNPISAMRLRGFEAGFGRAVAEEHQLNSAGYSLVAGGRAFRRYLELSRRPKAIFAACDEIAIGFIVAAEAHGMAPCRDFHLIGFDGQRIGRQVGGGSLTTIEVPVAALGRAAGEMAVRRLLNPSRPFQTTYLACDLYRGATVAAAES